MNKNKLNFIFFGTPDVASETLEILKSANLLPSLIVTSPDKRAGRKMILTPPPVKLWAEKNNVPFIQPEKLRDTEEILGILRTLGGSDGNGQRKFLTKNFRGEQNTLDFLSQSIPDLFIVVAYGKMLPEDILKVPKFGSINIHYSLLPKYRGASPVESAILNGDTATGVTIQRMEFAMDSGPILTSVEEKINENETTSELRKRLIKIGGELLIKTLPKILNDEIKPVPQDESKVSYSPKIKKEDGLIDLNDAGGKNFNKFRAYALWPRTFFFENAKRMIITKARLENGKFVIEKIIPEGGKEKEYKPN